MTSPTTCDQINTLGRYNLETKIRFAIKITKNQLLYFVLLIRMQHTALVSKQK